MPLFENAQNLSISGGNFNDFSSNGLDPLMFLEQCSAPGAMNDSMERFPPPRCHAETRKRALGTIEHWGTLPRADREKRLFWLHGPVGMGKTTIVQTIAEEFEAKNILGASFFFSRTDNNRNRAERFVASLALQLAISVPVLKRHVEAALRANPTILRKALPIQLKKLIIEPFRKIPPLDDDKVVAIDGLDECEGSRPNAQDKEREQLLILHLIETMLEADLPLNFFLASRPEAWIQEAFEDSPALSDTTQRMDLFEDSEKDADVELYFRDHLERIRHSKRHRFCFSNLTEPWPPKVTTTSIINSASGQFAYVDVIIRYLDDPYSNPVVQLETLFGGTACRANGADPMQQLDDLYRQILLARPNPSETQKALAWIVNTDFEYLPSVSFRLYEAIMGYEPGEMARSLRGLHALVRVPFDGTEGERAVIYHRSLVEFLKSPERCGTELYLGSYWTFLFRYRCLIYLSENPSLASLSAGSKLSDIHTYAIASCPSEGWCFLRHLENTPENRRMALHFARLFLARDPTDDMGPPGGPSWCSSAMDYIEADMASGYFHFSGEPSLLRKSFIHWRSAYRRSLNSSQSALDSQDRHFLHNLFDALHSLNTGQDTLQPFTHQQGHEYPWPQLYFDNVDLHGFLVTKGLSMGGAWAPDRFPQSFLVSLVYSYLPGDFYHLINAVQPTANRLLKGVHNVINRIWADLLQLGELNGPDLPERDRRILSSRMFGRMLSMLHLVRAPDEIPFLKNPHDAPRLWKVAGEESDGYVVRREIVRCALDANMPMAFAILSWWDSMMASTAYPDPEHKVHWHEQLRETEAFIRLFND